MVSAGMNTTRRLWRLLEFSVHSLRQDYGAAFLQRIALRHPLRTLRGAWALGRTRHLQLGPSGECRLGPSTEAGFVRSAAGCSKQLLVATGFCQKPLRTAGSDHDCPAGRFNHDCYCLARLDLNSPTHLQLPSACATCPIRLLGHAALQAGASFAILTSALDIAHDVLLPALEQQRFRQVLLAICPYSLEPMGLALSICGLDGYIFVYDSGACADYPQWLRADRGDKPECTTLPAHSLTRMQHLLEHIARARKREMPIQRASRYLQQGNVFCPR